MSIALEAAQRLYDAGWATALRESELVFPIVQSVHVLAIALMAGTIALVDLRVLGFVLRDEAPRAVLRSVLPFTWIGFAVMLASGLALFAAEAAKIVTNPAFLLKLALLAVAGANALAFHVAARRGDTIDSRMKLNAVASLLLWAGVIAAGRFVAFIVY